MKSLRLFGFASVMIFKMSFVFGGQICFDPQELSMKGRTDDMGEAWSAAPSEHWEYVAEKSASDSAKNDDKYNEKYYEIVEGGFGIGEIERRPSFLFQLFIDSAIENGDRVCLDNKYFQLKNEVDLYNGVSLEKNGKVLLLNPKNLAWTDSIFHCGKNQNRDLVSSSNQGILSCKKNNYYFLNRLRAQIASTENWIQINLNHLFESKDCKDCVKERERNNAFFEGVTCSTLFSIVKSPFETEQQ